MKHILTLCLMAFGAQCWAAGEQPVENFTAKLFTAKGTVEYLKKDTANWVAVKAPFMLEVGDQVKTGPKSKAELYMKYGSKIRLSEDTVFTISQVAPEGNAVEVMRGKMQAWIRKFTGRGFTVRTPSAVCAVRGTVFGVEVNEAGQTTWDLFSGNIQISDNRNRAIEMQPNQRLQVTQAEGAAPEGPVALPADVKPPSEPAKIKEEKEEIKAEKPIMEAQAKEAAAKAAAEKKAAEEAAAKAEAEKKAAEEAAAKAEAEKKAAEEAAAAAAAPVEEPAAVVPVIQEPVTTVIPTEVVIQNCEVSSSSPDCQ